MHFKQPPLEPAVELLYKTEYASTRSRSLGSDVRFARCCLARLFHPSQDLRASMRNTTEETGSPFSPVAESRTTTGNNPLCIIQLRRPWTNPASAESEKSSATFCWYSRLSDWPLSSSPAHSNVLSA